MSEAIMALMISVFIHYILSSTGNVHGKKTKIIGKELSYNRTSLSLNGTLELYNIKLKLVSIHGIIPSIVKGEYHDDVYKLIKVIAKDKNDRHHVIYFHYSWTFFVKLKIINIFVKIK